MDLKKHFVQMISVLLVVVIVACVVTDIKRSSEPVEDFVNPNYKENGSMDDTQSTEDYFENTEDIGNIEDTEVAESTDTSESTDVSEPTDEPDGAEDGEDPATQPEDEPLPENTRTVLTKALVNVRTGPGTDYDSLGQIPMDTEVTAVGDIEDGWQEIIFEGQTAYIFANYLEEVEE